VPSRPPAQKPHQPIKPPPPSEADAAAAQRLEVDRKFQQVKAEYQEFKRNFGARLEDRWQQILSDIALGRRDQGLSDALTALRQDMKRLRSEK
jgi:hypothetical protein